MSSSLVVTCALAVLALMTVLWLWSLVRRDASVVDPFWSIGFLHQCFALDFLMDWRISRGVFG